LKLLDSGFCRNDRKGDLQIFYEIIDLLMSKFSRRRLENFKKEKLIRHCLINLTQLGFCSQRLQNLKAKFWGLNI